MRFWQPILLAIWISPASAEPHYYVVIYSPGENWNVKLDYDQQEGIASHHRYLDTLFKRQKLLMSGPMAGQPGSMMIIVEESLDAAETIAGNDPGVSSDLLVAGVARWQVRNSALRLIRRAIPGVEATGSFTVERYDPDAPINLPE